LDNLQNIMFDLVSAFTFLIVLGKVVALWLRVRLARIHFSSLVMTIFCILCDKCDRVFMFKYFEHQCYNEIVHASCWIIKILSQYSVKYYVKIVYCNQKYYYGDIYFIPWVSKLIKKSCMFDIFGVVISVPILCWKQELVTF
jgi:hypothetical protein